MLLSRQQRVTMRCAGSATANDNVMPRPVTRTQRSLSGLSPACQPAVQHHTPTHTRLHPQDSMPAPRQQQLRDTPPLDFGDVDRPPANPELAASRQKLSDVLDADYWRQLCPWLHVCDEQLLAGAATIQLPAARLCDLAAQIDHAGVAQVGPEELPWAVHPDALAAGVVSLLRHGWPASALLVYDEAWLLIQQASHLMQHATGGNRVNMDILAWFVDPSRGHAGFSPHRDRQPDDAAATFRRDGSAMYATLWLPLTAATPENSCLYVVPRFADPGYFDGDPEDEQAPDPLTAALPDKQAYQHIRALPAAAGSAVIFTHRTIHWGSQGRPGYHTPRISISWGCADDAYEPPYFSRDALPCPPLGLRLALLGGQMICYHERFPAPPKQLALYYKAFTAQAAAFDAAYRDKVVLEFVGAGKEADAAAAAAAAAAGRDGAAAPAAPAAGGDGAAAPAAPAEGAGGKAGRSKKQQKQGDGTAGEAAGGEAEQQQQQEQAGKKRRRGKQQAEGGDASAAAEAQQAQQQAAGKKRKMGKQQQDGGGAAKEQQQLVPPRAARAKQGPRAKAAAARAAAPAAAAGSAGSSSDGEDDGEAIDWAALARAAKAARNGGGKRGFKGSGRAYKGAGKGGSGSGADDDDGDVLDMALDGMLDAQLAGVGGFADDFDDCE